MEKIPFLSFSETNNQIRKQVLDELESCFNSNWYILGDRVKKFEKSYAIFSGSRYCLGVANGLDALRIALQVCDVSRGDEVIIPSNTFIATALAVSQLGGVPILVEPRRETYNLDPNCLEQAITKKTKAIIPVHLYGQPCEMDRILEIARAHRLKVIEDNAQAQGGTFRGQVTGSFGDINATSFYPGKNLGALGDAGAITTQSIEFAQQAALIRNYGSVEKYKHEVQGFNSRLDEIQAGVLSIKLERLEAWNEQRRKLADAYQSALAGTGDLVLPYIANDVVPVFHLYVVRTQRRDELKTHLEKSGIGTMIHYPIPIHLQPAYQYL
jgi:dTDP-4-amino-4,6-dideoxygalactose transaminase